MAESSDVPALVLQLQGVRKTFNADLPNAVEVLHGIDLTMHAGEFCAVVGPSGSGKSTLLNIVGLLDRPTAGTVTICGQLTQGLADRALTQLRGHRIGFVFQYHHLLSAFTALENVLMPMLADAGSVNQQMVQRATDLLDQVGLHAYLAQPATELSGGQQQRVALARALAMQPALLLADEPTGNLDTVSADAVFALLRDISRNAGMAVLFVTHNEALASRCDRTINVVDGLIVG